ncbi:MAG TPA: hypothetical protein PLL69_00470 [Gemmatimonadales bacterium]|nr:hypothetical protein [Gemmatimonadales bacterium]
MAISVSAIILTTGCGDRSDQIPTEKVGLPSLEELHLATGAEDLPEREPTTIALTSDGLLSYPTAAREGSRFITIDSTGTIVARWSRAGEGPGESWTGYLASGDSVIALVSTNPPTLQVYTGRGELLSEQRGQPVDGFPQTALIGDSVDRSFGQRLVGRTHVLEDIPGPIVRACIYTDCRRELLGADHPILSQVHEATPRKGGLRWPPFAAEPGRFVLGDGVGYRLWLFDADGKTAMEFGRQLPPRGPTNREFDAELAARAGQINGGSAVDSAAVLKQLSQERLPHFGYGSLGFDGEHRLWVAGRTRYSTFLDVFADTTFLGRRMVDCQSDRGAFAVRGRWLGLVCVDESNDSTPIRVRLFRIVEGEHER